MSGDPHGIGPCAVTFGSVTFASTFGGVNITITDDVQLIYHDLQGTTPVDGYYKGTDIKVKIPIYDPTWAELVAAYPQLMALVATDDYVTISNPVGKAFTDIDDELILNPIQNVNAETPSDDDKYYFPSAAPVAVTDMGFDNENQRVWELDFQILVNTTTDVIATLGKAAS